MKNKEKLLGRIKNLSKKRGVIKGLAVTAALIALLNISALQANAEDITAVDGPLDDEIIFIDAPGFENNNPNVLNDTAVQSDFILPKDANKPELLDIADEEQINNRANYLYNKLSSDLGNLSYDAEFISGMIKIFNSRQPDKNGDLTNEKILLYLQQYYEMFYYYIDPTVDYYCGTKKDKPVASLIPISGFSRDNIMGSDITNNLEYCINGMLSAKTKNEAKKFVRMYAEIVFYSFYLKGGNGYTSHYLVESTGVRLLNIMTVMAAHPLAASIDNPTLEYHGVDGLGEPVDCKITLKELIKKINYQECPMTDLNRNIINEAIIGTMGEANQSAYIYK